MGAIRAVMMDPRLQPLADVIVKVLVREILDEKSHRCGEIQSGDKPDAIHREHLEGAA